MDVDNEDKCDIPMIVLSPPKQEEASRGTTDGDCDDDCESFYPTDPMSFAWQIARGMVDIGCFSIINHYNSFKYIEDNFLLGSLKTGD